MTAKKPGAGISPSSCFCLLDSAEIVAYRG
jgi:hypothetical protein